MELELNPQDPVLEPPAAADPPPPPQPPALIESPLTFNGSGGEYFRIWIVNLLLTLVTLGLYYPFAKVRRLRYFYNHTDIDGYTLDFHGNPWRMLRSMILVVIFFALYANAGKFSHVAGAIAFGSMIVLWPILVRASMQFRMGNTSWRGKRFRFAGSLKSAYFTVGIPLAVALIPLAAISFNVPEIGSGASKEQQEHAAQQFASMFGVLFLVLMLAAPYFYYLFERYLHDNYAYADQKSEFRATGGSFYILGLKVWGVSMLAFIALFFAIAIIALVMGGAGAAFQALRGDHVERSALPVVAVLAGIAIGAGYLGTIIFVRSYGLTRLQNLVWSQTGNAMVRIRSELKLWPYIKLTIKNWLLMVVTLGFYWPFAAVANYRIRVQAVTVVSRMPLDQLSGGATGGGSDATGDMAADLGGFDFGL